MHPIVSFRAIHKSFVGVTALTDVSLDLRAGEIHGFMGENGAGKSTLGKTLAGIHSPDRGELIVGGKPVHFHRPADALAAGVGMVHQELAFAPELSVAENLCMGVYPRRMLGLFLDRPSMHARARELLARIGAEGIDVRASMRSLNTAQEQLVQIASALGTGADILVFDEPTSSLSELDAQRLLVLIERLRSEGKTIVYVSHRMPEVFRLCDRISVLRDGKLVGTIDRELMTPDKLVQMMVGRSVQTHAPTRSMDASGEVRLRANNLSSPGKFDSVSFEVVSGEVVGMAGLVGSGRSEIATAIFGLDSNARGEVFLNGRALPLHDVRAAIRRGLGLVPEDRKRQGLVLGLSCVDNYALPSLRRLSTWRFFRNRRANREGGDLFYQLNVKAASLQTLAGTLSGGNQQKIVLAKWLARRCSVLILDEPTRGVDIAAKAAIHALIDALAHEGLAIIVISSELPEVIALSNRILVMHEGKLVDEIDRADATQAHLLRRMSNL